jgi:hypothetical protein
MGDNWAEQLIASDKATAWLMLPIGLQFQQRHPPSLCDHILNFVKPN